MHDLPIRSTLLLLSVLSLFGLQYAVFLPLFAKDILHSGARGLIADELRGVGAVLGPALCRAYGLQGTGAMDRGDVHDLRDWPGSIRGSRIFWLSSAVLLIVGFAVTSQMTATNTLIQSRVPDELRSRVMAVYATMMMGMQPIGSLIAAAWRNALERRERLPRLGFLYCWGALFSCFAW